MAQPDKKTLKGLFSDMLKIRRVEERIVALYPEQEMRCPVHLCIGQEAVAAGVTRNLSPNDLVLSNHRAHGHYLAKGGDLKKMFAEMYGKSTGCCQGRGGSMHLIDLSVNFLGSTPIVGGTIPVATGVAFAEKLQKRKTVSVCFFGDAAVEEGVFHESVNFAALKKLPVLFVCENNLYSVYTPLSERQPKREIYKLAAGYGILSLKADGNDVLKVYETTQQALKKVRAGGGPAFLEFTTYRWREHCGPNYDNDLGYRSEKEFKTWKKKCPIERFRKYLLEKRVLTLKDLDVLENDIKRDIDAAVAFAKSGLLGGRELAESDAYAP